MERWTKWSAKLSCSKLLRSTALLLISIYRINISGLTGAVCRFEPTCSCYAQQAFQTHPPVRAFFLTLKRLSKCHPFGPFGWDPVPAHRERNS